jgi:hypothetical protein
MSTDTHYGIDPVFNDTYIANDCNLCGREFNYTQYKSDTCEICDDKSEPEKEWEKEKSTIIYALEEYAKVLEGQNGIEWRNYVLELIWKVSAMERIDE